MSVRDDPVLFLRGGKAGGTASAAVGGGSAITTTRPHRLDGAEHQAADDTTRLDATTTQHGLLPKLSGAATDVLRGDGTWSPVIPTKRWEPHVDYTGSVMLDSAGNPIMHEVLI